MAKPFKILRDKVSPEARRRSKEMADEMMREIRLTELRSVLGVSQEELAQLLKNKPPFPALNEGRTCISLRFVSLLLLSEVVCNSSQVFRMARII